MKLATLKLIEELLVAEQDKIREEIREENRKQLEDRCDAFTLTVSTDRLDKVRFALDELRRYDFT